jgi:hypothetical protein
MIPLWVDKSAKHYQKMGQALCLIWERQLMFAKYRSMRKSCALILLLALLGLSLAACGTDDGGTSGNNGGNTPVPASTSTPAQTSVPSNPFKVASVDMSVSLSSLKGISCGKSITVTYTATFHFPANSAGGQVMFQYTTTNGRGSTPASLSVPPGQTTVAYQFTWSGQLPADHTQPGLGGVMVTSPNALTSALVGPTGECTSAPTPTPTVVPAAFKVVSIELTASPTLNGVKCGTMFTETYKATFHIAPNGPGGTIVFTYTTDNGRGNSQNISLHVNAGQTTATYTFKWSGTLPPDHTAPGVGIVLMTAPNQGESPDAVPTGSCS